MLRRKFSFLIIGNNFIFLKSNWSNKSITQLLDKKKTGKNLKLIKTNVYVKQTQEAMTEMMNSVSEQLNHLILQRW